jgi:hypothetical protein
MPKTQYLNRVGCSFEATDNQIGREHEHTDARPIFSPTVHAPALTVAIQQSPSTYLQTLSATSALSAAMNFVICSKSAKALLE